MSLKEDIEAQSKKYGGGGGNSDFFQFKKGLNRMRILAEPKVIAFHFFGRGEKPVICIGIDEGCQYHKKDDKKSSIKLATYIIDRDDENKIKFAELPLSISYSLSDLQEDSDFAFEDFPMPYDVKVTSDPENVDPKSKYRLVASPKQEPLTTGEKEGLDEAMKKMTPEQYVQIRKDKQKGEKTSDKEYPEEDLSGDVPF